MRITNKHFLWFILVISVALRLYDYPSIPFTHDEFSAFFRLDFKDFSTLIREGVMVDGHPAGIQVFLYYWTMLFGREPWVMKLPFTIMGLASVYLVFLVGRQWINETAGLLSAAYLASIQFTIMYSQIARPYISGLFFILLMFFFWSRLIKMPGRHFFTNGLLFAVAAALCAYNHHFSLLLAAITGATGTFLIQKKYLKKYLMVCGAAVILYLPHINIFLNQLSMGGVESWLRKPDNDFLIQYIAYIFHYSALSWIPAIALFLTAILQKELSPHKDKSYRKNMILFALLFLLPYAIGFYYSRYLSAVLQYSVLIFSMPFLFLLLFAPIKPLKPTFTAIALLVILSANIFTLITHRQHYTLFYQSHYNAIITDFCREGDEHKVLPLIDSDSLITAYYLEKEGLEDKFFRVSDFADEASFYDFLKKSFFRYSGVYLGAYSHSDPLVPALIMEYYPYITCQRNYVHGTTGYFSARPPGYYRDTVVFNNFSGMYDNTGKASNYMFCDSMAFSGSASLFMDSSREWGYSIELDINEVISHGNDFVDISLKVLPTDKPVKAIIVCELHQNGEIVHWSGNTFATPLTSDIDSQWQTLFHSLKFSDIPQRAKNMKNTTLKVYVWNKGLQSFYMDNFLVRRRQGNPVLYGLTERV